MSDADKEASEKVYYLSDYSFFYYENKYTSALETGERFRNCDEVIYSLKPGEYSLKLMDVR